MGFDWAKRRFREKIKIEIDRDLDINFETGTSVPAAWLRFKLRSVSEANLIPNKIEMWILIGGIPIDEMNWSKHANASAQLLGINRYHKIPEIIPARQAQDVWFQFYYPLPFHIDLGKYKLSINGIIDFDCIFGTINKSFCVENNLMEAKWKNALDAWKKDYEGKETLLSVRTTAPAYTDKT